MLYLTGNTAAIQGGGVSVAHGVTGNKIIACQVSVEYAAANFIPSGYSQSAGYEFNVNWNNSTVSVINTPANSANILNKPFRVCIIYIQ
jgi:hypothetical protein